MSLTPEQAQALTELQQRMLANIQLGKEAHDGMTEEDLHRALSFLRQNRAASGAAAGEASKKKAAAKKKAKPSVEIDTKFFDGFSFD